jgi:hypothetical protein
MEKKNMKNDLFYRSAEIEERDIDAEGRSVNLSFSSEIGVQKWFGIEVLSHKEGAIIKGRLRSLLFGHNRERIIGPVKSVKYEDGKGRAKAGFDKTEEGDLALVRVQSGSLQGVSVGYAVERLKKLAEGEEYDVGTRKVKGTGQDNPTYIAERWCPMEISLTPTPADHTVGIGREATRSLDGIEIDEPSPIPAPQGTNADNGSQTKEKGGSEKMELTEKELQAKIDAALSARDTAHKERMKKIFDRAAPVKLEGLAFQLYIQGKSEDEITDAILAEVGKQRGKPADGGDPSEAARTAAIDKISDDDLATGLMDPGWIAF